MRVLIVDDEVPARLKLARMLHTFSDIEIIGEAADGGVALELVEKMQPDVLFLDMQMPEIGGFDVAASLPDDGPAIVFVTAFDQYALRAFDTNAIDYLLKPVDPERLARAIERLRHASPPTRPRLAVPAQLIVADRGKNHLISCADIEWLEAADNYVHIHLPSHSFLMRRTLNALLGDLGPGFFRIHRGVAVALNAVQTVLRRAKGDATVMLRSGAQLPCSRQYREALMDRLR